MKLGSSEAKRAQLAGKLSDPRLKREERGSSEARKLPKLIAIVGPTASGKTDVSLALARRFKGEIINCDSRQLYRGVALGADIIPGKWVKRGRRRVWLAQDVPHYLINFLSPKQTMTVAEYKKKAERRAKEIAGRGRLPFLVGGTGLYASAVIDNYQMPEVPPNEAFRRRLNKKSAAALQAELKKKDPAYAARAGLNKRYLIRALEVIRATGRPFSELQRKGEPQFDALILGVARPREEIYARVNRRFDRMVGEGLLEEADRLGRRYGWDNPAASSLGHRQLGLHLQGKMTLVEALELAKSATRDYAKRQITWFKRDPRIHWVSSIKEAEGLILAHLERG